MKSKYSPSQFSLFFTNSHRFRKPYGVLDGELLMRLKEINPANGYNSVLNLSSQDMEYAEQFSNFLANLST